MGITQDKRMTMSLNNKGPGLIDQLSYCKELWSFRGLEVQQSPSDTMLSDQL